MGASRRPRRLLLVVERGDGRAPAFGVAIGPVLGPAGHGERQQTCLAHLARDVAYAAEASDDLLALRFKWWLDNAFGLARRLTALAASTLARKRRELEGDLDAS